MTEAAQFDKIQSLPGLDASVKLDFHQYSGFLQGSTPNYQLHYWLIEHASGTTDDSIPLILWLNGGPGCSSMEGLMAENGPFRVNDKGGLDLNPYSWNKFAHVLYLEAPAGVGFSYAADGNVTTDDDLTALNNFHALKHFVEKFPKFRGRDFKITGESYAGVYVPTLALQVLSNKWTGLNLKGIVVGNGLTSYKMNDNSLIYFMQYHGLFDSDEWKQLLDHCCSGQSASRCDFSSVTTDACTQQLQSVAERLNGLNIYNLYSECVQPKSSNFLNSANVTSKIVQHSDFGNLFRSIPKLQAHFQRLNSGDGGVKGRLVIPCTDDSALVNYLNNRDVKRSIHMDKVPTSRKDVPWDVCDAQVNLEYIRTYTDLTQQYSAILASKVSILIYNGDVDMACNFIGDNWFVDQLGLETTLSYGSWSYTAQDGSSQIGGFRKALKMPEPNSSHARLIFTTVRGAGHMVPFDKPVASFHLVKTFVIDA